MDDALVPARPPAVDGGGAAVRQASPHSFSSLEVNYENRPKHHRDGYRRYQPRGAPRLRRRRGIAQGRLLRRHRRGEPKSFLSVVGVWRVEAEGNNKVIAVDGRQWKESPT